MKQQMKIRMSFDEMAEAYVSNNPGFKPNSTNVGKYAKSQGYRPARQMVNRKIERFYIKSND